MHNPWYVKIYLSDIFLSKCDVYGFLGYFRVVMLGYTLPYQLFFWEHSGIKVGRPAIHSLSWAMAGILCHVYWGKLPPQCSTQYTYTVFGWTIPLFKSEKCGHSPCITQIISLNIPRKYQGILYRKFLIIHLP